MRPRSGYTRPHMLPVGAKDRVAGAEEREEWNGFIFQYPKTKHLNQWFQLKPTHSYIFLEMKWLDIFKEYSFLRNHVVRFHFSVCLRIKHWNHLSFCHSITFHSWSQPNMSFHLRLRPRLNTYNLTYRRADGRRRLSREFFWMGIEKCRRLLCE